MIRNYFIIWKTDKESSIWLWIIWIVPLGNQTRDEEKNLFKKVWQDFPGGAVVKNPPANAGDTALSSGPGRYHMLQSN